MKHNYLKHLFTALLLLCATVATAHDFEVDGIYYRITNRTYGYVAVTYKGSSDTSAAYTGSVVIPESVTYNGTTYSVTSIGYKAFNECSGLTSVVIPSSVTSIGYDAFSGTAWYDNQPDGVIYAGKVLYKYKGTMPVNTSIVVKEGTCEIAGFAFEYCSGLKSIVIPNSVTSIGDGAFYSCSGLKSIVIPNSVTSIGGSAFKYCSGLTSIVIPNSVTFIGEHAFYACYGLTGELVIPNGVTGIGEWTFWQCSRLTSIEIPNSVTSIGRSAFEGCDGLKSIVIPNSVTSICDAVFQSCDGLKSIVIPNSVTSIGSCAFYNCDGLTSVEIPNSVTSIGAHAFFDCDGLTSLSIPNSVTSIGRCAFENCSGLKSVTIGNNVTDIVDYAFSGCTRLTSITSLIPVENLFTISSYVFGSIDKTTCTLYVPYGAKEAYAATAGWNEFTNIVEIIPSDVTITINEYGSATYCSEYALDFSNVEGLKAYAATGYNVNTGVVTLTRLQTAREGTGLFLKGEPGDEYVVPVLEETGDHSLNMLVGTLKETTVNSISSDDLYANYKYTINEGTSTPMFYQFADGSSLSANKAYLQIPLAWLKASASKSVEIRFDDGETTDIDEVEGEDADVDIVYDLQGRAVENPTKGIYIVDGKKVFINK